MNELELTELEFQVSFIRRCEKKKDKNAHKYKLFLKLLSLVRRLCVFRNWVCTKYWKGKKNISNQKPSVLERSSKLIRLFIVYLLVFFVCLIVFLPASYYSMFSQATCILVFPTIKSEFKLLLSFTYISKNCSYHYLFNWIEHCLNNMPILFKKKKRKERCVWG